MAPLPSTPELDELTITILVDNATLSSIGPGIPQLPDIAYLCSAASRPPLRAGLDRQEQ